MNLSLREEVAAKRQFSGKGSKVKNEPVNGDQLDQTDGGGKPKTKVSGDHLPLVFKIKKKKDKKNCQTGNQLGWVNLTFLGKNRHAQTTQKGTRSIRNWWG